MVVSKPRKCRMLSELLLVWDLLLVGGVQIVKY
jgi:hypothetical protein